jgi:hypothetical protein
LIAGGVASGLSLIALAIICRTAGKRHSSPSLVIPAARAPQTFASFQEGLQNLPSLLQAGEAQSLARLIGAHQKVEKSDSSRAAAIPFHEIPTGLPGKLFLGNDSVREKLMQKAHNVDTLNGIHQEQMDLYGLGAGALADYQKAGMFTQIPALVVTCKGQTNSSLDALLDDQDPGLQGGIVHLHFPINENKRDLYPRLMREGKLFEIFQAIDRALTDRSGYNLLIHCNQGEHRSVCVLALYLVSRAQVTFEEAWNYINSIRAIKDLNRPLFQAAAVATSRS